MSDVGRIQWKLNLCWEVYYDNIIRVVDIKFLMNLLFFDGLMLYIHYIKII